MSETPDWLEGYAKQQGWGDAPQPDPKDVAELQAYADTFAPKQPSGADVADLQGTAAALDQPSPIVDNDAAQPSGTAHAMADFSLPESWTEKGKVALDALKQTTGLAGVSNTAQQPDPQAPQWLKDAALKNMGEHGANIDAQGGFEDVRKDAAQKSSAEDIAKRQAEAKSTPVDDAAPAASQGHWVNGQWVRTVSPTALGMEGKLERERGEHAGDEADAARALAMQREQIYNKRSAELQAQQDAARVEQQRQQIARDKAEKDYDHAAQLSQAAKVDPDNFWAHKSTGARMMAILGVALGAVGSSMTHTPNDALEMIKSGMEHDLEAQKLNAQNAQKGTENAWQKLRAATGSAQQADNLYRVAALQTVQGQLDELNAGPQQRAGIDAALKQAQDQQQARALQFRLQTEKYSPGYMTGGGAAGGAEADPEKVVQMGHESVGGYAPNTRLVFGKKEDAAAVTDQMQAYGIVQKARNAIADLEKKNPLAIYTPGSEAYEDAKQIRLQAVTQIGHLNGVKKLPIFDAEHLNDALDTHMYNAAIGAGATHRMDTYLQNAKDALDESVQTRAAEVVRRHLDVNQRGEVTPGNHYTGENIERHAMPKSMKVVGGTGAATGTRELAPVQYKPEVRHVTETPGKGKKKGTSAVTSTEPEEDDE